MVTASLYMGKGLQFFADHVLTWTNCHSCGRYGEHFGADQTYVWLIRSSTDGRPWPPRKPFSC